MDQKTRYLRMAEEAEKQAAAATDWQLKSAWTCIAESYRELAVLKASLRDPVR